MATDSLVPLRTALFNLPGEVRTEIRAEGIPQTEADVDALVAKYNLTPAQKTTLMTLQSGAAELGVTRFDQLLQQATRDRTVTVTTRYRTEGRPAPIQGGMIARAHGGILSTVSGGRTVSAYAAGGFDVPNGHLPEIARPSVTPRIWAEEETGGEGYVPLANDWRRPRAKAVTEKLVSHFGGEVRWYAGGGANPGRDYFRAPAASTSTAVGVERLVAAAERSAAAATRAADRAADALAEVGERVEQGAFRGTKDAGEGRAQRINAMSETGGAWR